MWFDIMDWQLAALIVSIIVLVFDIVWQFLIAGMYAPKKAHRLIIDDPLIKRLDKELTLLNEKLVTIEGKLGGDGGAADLRDLENEIRNLAYKLENDKPLEGVVTQVSEKLVDMKENIKSYIKGHIGVQAKDFYNQLEIDEGAFLGNAADPDSPQNQLIIHEAELEMEFNMIYGLLNVVMEDETAIAWANRYVRAPKFLKNILRKKINDWTGGTLEEVEKTF